MYQISGNKIYWPANDVTPLTLNCGIKISRSAILQMNRR